MFFQTLCIIVLLLVQHCFSTEYFPVEEFDALEDFYNALNGPHWIWRENSGLLGDDDYLIDIGPTTNHGAKWNFTGYHNPCLEHWQGINCTCIVVNSTFSQCSTLAIELANHNLKGQIPQSIGNFPNLRVLYLLSNRITGSIPTALGQLANLQFLSLAYNQLVSNIPYALSGCISLQHLHLEYNGLTGTIPDQIYSMTELSYLDVGHNKLHGVFSPLIGNLYNLQWLYLCNNSFTGSIPEEISNLTKLNNLYLYNNLLHGNISSVESLHLLNFLYVFDNMITGTIPSWIGRLLSFDAGLTQMTGSIPSAMCDGRFTLSGLLLYSLPLTGTIPACLTGPESRMIELILYNNMLTGTISMNFSTNASNVLLESFVVGQNFFTGTLPSMKNTTLLQFYYVQNNFFSGKLHELFQSKQHALFYVDFSNNEFTGSIPDVFYELRFLRSIAMVSNCFTGSISNAICNMTSVQYIDFDGLHTASNCQRRLFPSFDSYIMNDHIHGTIPACIFALPKLQTIHLSGNSLKSSLPTDLEISDSVLDITLSHNKLRGDIPTAMQNRRYSILDLSYNSFSGTLAHDFNVSDETYLDGNRLSGNVPNSFRNAENISILNSNMFSCNLLKTSLPRNDPNLNSFECGSNSFNQSLLLWGVVVGFFCLFLLGALWTRSTTHSVHFTELRDWFLVSIVFVDKCLSVFTYDPMKAKQSSIVNLGQYLRDLRLTFLRLTTVICVGLTPLYLILSIFFATYAHEYAWNVSAVYLSGQAPAIILLLVFLGLLYYVMFSVQNLLKKWLEDSLIPDPHSHLIKDAMSKRALNTLRMGAMCLVALGNCTVMVVLNGIYVYFVFKYSPLIVLICQLLLALFKILWNDYVLTWTVRYTQKSTQYASIDQTEAEDHMPRFEYVLQRSNTFVSVGSTRPIDIRKKQVYVPLRIRLSRFLQDNWPGKTFRNASTQTGMFGIGKILMVSNKPWKNKYLKFSIYDRLKFSLKLHGMWCGKETTTGEYSSQTEGEYTDRTGTNLEVDHQMVADEKARQSQVSKELQELRRWENAYDMPVLTFILIFNTIIAPVVANSILSDECYQSVFLPPESISSTGSYSVCLQQYSLPVTNVFCFQDATAYLDTTYDPPFIYRYGCSSSFIRNYASVFVFMFLMTGFGKPAVLFTFKFIYDNTTSMHLRWLMSKCLNKLLKEDNIDEERLEGEEILFRGERFVLSNITAVSVFLTVGVVFPPVAVVVLIAIVNHTLMNQIIIGRFVNHRMLTGNKRELALNTLRRDCDGIPLLFKNATVSLIIFTSMFYAFYLMDIYGDEVGWRHALWAPVAMFLLPICYRAFQLCNAADVQHNQHESVKNQISLKLNETQKRTWSVNPIVAQVEMSDRKTSVNSRDAAV